jgi:hypothetical protein
LLLQAEALRKQAEIEKQQELLLQKQQAEQLRVQQQQQEYMYQQHLIRQQQYYAAQQGNYFNNNQQGNWGTNGGGTHSNNLMYAMGMGGSDASGVGGLNHLQQQQYQTVRLPFFCLRFVSWILFYIITIWLCLCRVPVLLLCSI